MMKFLPKYMSLRIKMLVVIVARISIVFLVIYFWLSNFFAQSSRQALQADVEDVLHSGRAALKADDLAGLASSPAAGPADPRHKAIADWFAQVNAFDPGATPYLYYQSAPGRLSILADDMGLKNPQSGLAYADGARIEAGPDSFLWAGLKQENLDLEPHDTRQGTAVSGALPILDASGHVVAALAVDAAPGPAAAGQLRAQANLLPLLGLVYVLLSSSVWFITGNLTRTLRALDQASKRVGEGDYAPVDVKPGFFEDEITRLTATLNQMIEKVRGREEKLRKQVESLSIQVDQAKRQRAVDEVVDSDFFRDLKSKARTLRDEHADDKPAE